MRAFTAIGRAGGRILTAVAVVAAGLVLAAPAGAATYRVIDLGTLGGGSSGATDLNDAGAVVGWSRTASGQVHAVVRTPSGGGRTGERCTTSSCRFRCGSATPARSSATPRTRRASPSRRIETGTGGLGCR